MSANERISAYYYKLKGSWDLTSKNDHVALSKARTVINHMTSSLLTHDEHMSLKRAISHVERERIFRKSCWDGLRTALYPDYTGEDLDRFRIGECSYLTILENRRAKRLC